MTAEEYIENAISAQGMLTTMVRELSSAKVPEFSSEPMTIEDVSNLTGIPETSVRAGILHGWLPIGVQYQSGINAEVILGGMISGLASTGLYEMLRNLLEKDGKKEK